MANIRVTLHQREDEIIFIRMGNGIATLGDREIPVASGATIYVPRGVWHGLRNNGQDTLGMSATYSPPGFEQSFKQRLLRPRGRRQKSRRIGRSTASSTATHNIPARHPSLAF